MVTVRQLSGLFGLGNNWCKPPLVGQPAARMTVDQSQDNVVFQITIKQAEFY